MSKSNPNPYLKRLSSVLTGNDEQIGFICWLGSIVKRFLWMREWMQRREVKNMSQVQVNIEFAQSTALCETDSFKEDVFKQLDDSDKSAFQILLDETSDVFIKISNSSIRYSEKYNLLNELNGDWFNFWQKFKIFHEAVPLIQKIDVFTDYILAYQYLYLSLSYINESDFSDDLKILENKVYGFEFLAQTVEIFGKIISDNILYQVLSESRRIFSSIKPRILSEYLKSPLEESIVTTRLKAALSLILFNLQFLDEAVDFSQSNHTDGYAETKAFSRLKDIDNPDQWVVGVGREEKIDLEELDKKIRESGYLV